tara:strand:- start:4332 stop:5147 length:816 start_codon:yes stop_codon:yes gene_type:complete
MSKAQTKDVEAKKQSAVPAIMDLEQAAGQGSEYVTARDTKLPILKILYSNSPVLDESDGKYIETAKQGDIYNEITGSLYKGKEGCIVVPCLYINTFNEWKDRGDSPGRPVGIHTDASILSQTNRGDDGKDRLENGNYVEDTGNHFVYILDKDYQPIETALITMKSTQKKKSKTWNSMMQSRRLKGKHGMFQPPSWATSYKLTTTKESNGNNSWYGWVVEFDKYLNDPKLANTLEATKGFYESAVKSDIFGKVDFGKEEDVKKVDNKTSVPF